MARQSTREERIATAKRKVESAQANLNIALEELTRAQRPDPEEPLIGTTLTFSYNEDGVIYRVVATRNDTMRWSVNRWRTTNLAGNDSYPTRWESNWDSLVSMIERCQKAKQLVVYPSVMYVGQTPIAGFTS